MRSCCTIWYSEGRSTEVLHGPTTPTQFPRCPTNTCCSGQLHVRQTDDCSVFACPFAGPSVLSRGNRKCAHLPRAPRLYKSRPKLLPVQIQRPLPLCGLLATSILTHNTVFASALTSESRRRRLTSTAGILLIRTNIFLPPTSAVLSAGFRDR